MDDSPQPAERHDVEISKPLALRALAHPLRWQLIDLLGGEGTATATRCAEVTGESVASCSYHLGILAKYGYIELVPDQPGREKPWRLTSFRQELSAGPGLEGELAAEAATEAFLDHEFARTRRLRRRRSMEPAAWQEASCLLGSTLWVTAEELHEISAKLCEIAVRYGDRLEHPDLRPADARQARVFISAAPMAPTQGERAAPPQAERDVED